MLCLGLLLAGCATKPRIGPPAPVENAGAGTAWAGANAAEAGPKPQGEPETSQVEVYAYRAPGQPEAEGPASTTAGQAASGQAATSGSALRMERPTVTGGGPAPSGGSTPAGQASAQIAYAPPPKRPSLSRPVEALVQQAEQQRETRDYVGAAATLERALRIDPQEPYLWNRLAHVRLQQGYQGQAENLAARSNSLAGDQPELKQDNWRIIAAARRAAGDTAGAAAAAQKASGG